MRKRKIVAVLLIIGGYAWFTSALLFPAPFGLSVPVWIMISVVALFALAVIGVWIGMKKRKSTPVS